MLPELPEVDVRLLHGQATDQVLGEHIGRQPPQLVPDRIDEGDADGVLGHRHLDEPLATLVAGGKSSRQQVAEQKDLDAMGAHLFDELVVLVLRPLHPENVVEEQLVVIGRGEPLQAQLGSVNHHLPQLPHLRVDSETRHDTCSFVLSFKRGPPGFLHCLPRSGRSRRGHRWRRACRCAPRNAPPPRPWDPWSLRRSRVSADRRE